MVSDSVYARRTDALQRYTYALSEADTRSKLIDPNLRARVKSLNCCQFCP